MRDPTVLEMTGNNRKFLVADAHYGKGKASFVLFELFSESTGQVFGYFLLE